MMNFVRTIRKPGGRFFGNIVAWWRHTLRVAPIKNCKPLQHLIPALARQSVRLEV